MQGLRNAGTKGLGTKGLGIAAEMETDPENGKTKKCRD
jgi:hypothetical protein